eukprot:1922010-Rhodomonas_salina.3
MIDGLEVYTKHAALVVHERNDEVTGKQRGIERTNKGKKKGEQRQQQSIHNDDLEQGFAEKSLKAPRANRTRKGRGERWKACRKRTAEKRDAHDLPGAVEVARADVIVAETADEEPREDESDEWRNHLQSRVQDGSEVRVNSETTEN